MEELEVMVHEEDLEVSSVYLEVPDADLEV